MKNIQPLSNLANGIMDKIIEFLRGKSFLYVSWLSSTKFNLTTSEVTFSFDSHMLQFYQNLRDYFETIEVKAS